MGYPSEHDFMTKKTKIWIYVSLIVVALIVGGIVGSLFNKPSTSQNQCNKGESLLTTEFCNSQGYTSGYAYAFYGEQSGQMQEMNSFHIYCERTNVNGIKENKHFFNNNLLNSMGVEISP